MAISTTDHSALAGADLHPAFRQASADPGPVGAGKGWQDTDDDALRIRNAADSGWILLATGSFTPDYAEDGDITTAAFGDAPAANVTTEIAPAGHRHGMPANPVTAHVAAGDPHTVYRLEADDHSHASTGLQGGTISHAVLTGVTANQHHNQLHAATHLTGGGDVLALVHTINFLIDGGGLVITTGLKGDLVVDFACTISKWTLLADVSGSIVVDIWKDTYANYPPVIGDVITASAKPTITTATKGQSSTLTGWTTAIAAGDVLRFNVNSVTSITRVLLALTVTRT